MNAQQLAERIRHLEHAMDKNKLADEITKTPRQLQRRTAMNANELADWLECEPMGYLSGCENMEASAAMLRAQFIEITDDNRTIKQQAVEIERLRGALETIRTATACPYSKRIAHAALEKT